MYPPYQFRDEFMVRHKRGELQPLTAEMRETMGGFPRDHTFPCWTSEAKRRGPRGWEYARCCFISNTMHVPTQAYLTAPLMLEWGSILG